MDDTKNQAPALRNPEFIPSHLRQGVTNTGVQYTFVCIIHNQRGHRMLARQ